MPKAFSCLANKYRRKSPQGRLHREQGAIMAEAVAATAIFIPLIFFVISATFVAAYAFVIGINMNEAAYVAARALGKTFQAYPGIVSDLNEQQDIFATIRIPNMVSGNDQFVIPDDGWQLLQKPRTVTVTVRYLSGQGDPALPLYPNPDYFKMRSWFVIESSATYCLD